MMDDRTPPEGSPSDSTLRPFERSLNRRDLFLNAAKFTAAAAAAGPFFMAAEQAAAAERASTSAAAGDPIAAAAVSAAKKYSGNTVNTLYEAGLQSLDPIDFSGPLFHKLTGVKTNVIQAPFPTAYSKAIAEHLAGSGTYDNIDTATQWLADFVDRGVIQPIDDFITKYNVQATLTDVHPLYRAQPQYKGKHWGFFDDGDMYILYYRKDVFADAKLRKAYRAQFKRDLRVPRTYPEFIEVAQFITKQMAPKLYGTAMLRAIGNSAWSDFSQEFLARGGQYFDPKTMKPMVNSPLGVKVMEDLIKLTPAEPPGANKLDAVSAWTEWLQGKSAMMWSWPPTGRISENIAQSSKAWSFIPKSKIAGKVGYALCPLRHGVNTGGYIKCISADSKNAELTFLHSLWMTSPSVSLQRVMLPYSLRDPYRISHYNSKAYQHMWPTAKEYLVQLANGANNAVVDMYLPGAQDYYNALDRSMSGMFAGANVKNSLDTVAQEWEKITDQRGRETQRQAYALFLKQPGSTNKRTVASLGESVKVT